MSRTPRALALLACLTSACGSDPPQATSPCNVLLISIDSLRADHVGCYGYERDTSPNLDRLAADGTLFETVVAESSWTLPTHLSMFTGLSTGVHGVYDDSYQLQPRHRTLAEELQAAGWRTHGIWSGPYLHPIFGFGRGFDGYEGLIARTRLDREEFDVSNTTDQRQRVIERAHGRSHQSITSPAVADGAISFLEQGGDDPFFLFLHFFDVHYDYIPPEEHWRRFDPDYQGTLSPEDFFSNPAIASGMDERDLRHVIARYDGEILFTDEHIGRVLDALARLDLERDTLVLITSDHGDEFFEHGGKGHRRTLYDEVLLVPLIARQPGRVAAGQRISAQVRHIDLTPTILDWVGLPGSNTMMGKSFAAALGGETELEELPAIATLGDPLGGASWTALRRSKWKWIHRRLRSTRKERDLFYDLGADAEEKNPLQDASRLELAKSELERIRTLERFLRQVTDVDGAADLELPEELQAELRALGYAE